MFVLSSYSRKINTPLLPSYFQRAGEIVRDKRARENPSALYDQAIFSGWLPLRFVKNECSWKACLTAPEISGYILNHSEILIYYKRNDTILKVTHYTDEDFGMSTLWVDHCVLLQKILLISNFDASALYRYIILPEGLRNGVSSSRPDPKDYQAVCQYYNIP